MTKLEKLREWCEEEDKNIEGYYDDWYVEQEVDETYQKVITEIDRLTAEEEDENP